LNKKKIRDEVYKDLSPVFTKQGEYKKYDFKPVKSGKTAEISSYGYHYWDTTQIPSKNSV